MRLQSVCLTFYFIFVKYGVSMASKEMAMYREKARAMFYHAYDSYIHYAYPKDELAPLSCSGRDTWGNYSLSLIDAMDTLIVLGNYSEFTRIYNLVEKIDFTIDKNVSVFETNIRVIGGLLSAHLLAYKVPGLSLDVDWPCDGPLLRKALDVADRLLPAFNTPTGLPYGTVNLKYGVPREETTVTCTASCGTFIIEFGVLSRLSGDPRYESVALRALKSLWESRSKIGLVGNHIDIMTGKWVAQDSGIGGGVDSYLEYLLKGGVLFRNAVLLNQFREYYSAINERLRREDWYMWARMDTADITMTVFQSLEAFWPGLQTLVGDVDLAARTASNYHLIWERYGATPEMLELKAGLPVTGREGYPLRPELVESLMYLYQATKDSYWLEVGRNVLESIESSARVPCGYATFRSVVTHELEDRMESFFLSETTKYLYLLFDPDHFLHKDVTDLSKDDYERLPVDPESGCDLGVGGYLFNTEAHPINVGALSCCRPYGEDWMTENDEDGESDFSIADAVEAESVTLPSAFGELLSNLAEQMGFRVKVVTGNSTVSVSSSNETSGNGTDEVKIVLNQNNAASPSKDEENVFQGSGFLWLTSTLHRPIQTSINDTCEMEGAFGCHPLPTLSFACLARPYDSKFAQLGVTLSDDLIGKNLNDTQEDV